MKRLLLLLFGLVTGLAQAQAQAPAAALRPDPATQRLARTETVLVPGASQADLYARAQAWLAAAYQTTPVVAPPKAGVVQGIGWREIEMRMTETKSQPLNLWYTVTVAVQPGRYSYTITEFQTQREPTPGTTAPEKQAIESVISNESAPPIIRTNYSQQAADAAQAVAETIKAGMAPASSARADVH